MVDLTARKAEGAQVDERNIRKHANDILRLTQLLTPETRVELTSGIRLDVADFLLRFGATLSSQTKIPGVPRVNPRDALANLATVFGIAAGVPVP